MNKDITNATLLMIAELAGDYYNKTHGGDE